MNKITVNSIKLNDPEEYLQRMKYFDPLTYDILNLFIGRERLNPEDNIGDFTDFVCDSPTTENKENP